jgi:exoribonuclease II
MTNADQSEHRIIKFVIEQESELTKQDDQTMNIDLRRRTNEVVNRLTQLRDSL